MQPIKITYRVSMAEDFSEVIDLEIDPVSLELMNQQIDNLPEWTRLEYQTCPHCPLPKGSQPHCPVALNLVEIVELFNKIVSYDEVDLEVVTRERTYSQHTTAQKAVSSLFGVLIATSGCPYTTFLKPMARFHLPLATQEETIYRVSSTYLLAQYYLAKKGQSTDKDLKGLHQLYSDLHVVNVEIASRLRNWTEEDASVNAIVLLDVFANVLPFAIEDELERLESIFDSYMPD